MAAPDNKVFGYNQRKFTKDQDVFLKGTLKWVKHLQPDFQWEPDGKWSCVVYLVGPELDKARELQGKGIKNTIKKDDDGWHMTLSRKCSYETKGRKIGREPPKVFQMVGDREEPVVVPIGNGSTGIAKCILWSSPNFPGANLRWEALRVDSLVPFNIKEDYPDGGESIKELILQEEEALF